MVFHGELRADEHARAHLHESPPSMTVPLVVLSLGSIFSGWLGAPEYLWGSKWERWLGPLFGAAEAHHGSVETELLVTGATLLVVIVAVYLAYRTFGRGAPVTIGGEPRAGFGRLLANRYYIDEFYDRVVVRPFTGTATWLARVFDPAVIDGAVNGIAGGAQRMSVLWQTLQSGNVQHYLVGFLVGALALLGYYMGQP
jgi:NADH-quinone oxidoreductase subunit L